MAPCGPAAGPAVTERTQQAVQGQPGSACGQLQVSEAPSAAPAPRDTSVQSPRAPAVVPLLAHPRQGTMKPVFIAHTRALLENVG